MIRWEPTGATKSSMRIVKAIKSILDTLSSKTPFTDSQNGKSRKHRIMRLCGVLMSRPIPMKLMRLPAAIR
jgi:hypothetical protein